MAGKHRIRVHPHKQQNPDGAHFKNGAEAVGLGLVRKTSSDQLLHFQQAALHQLNCLFLLRAGDEKCACEVNFCNSSFKPTCERCSLFFPLFFYVYFLCVNNCKCSRATFARCSCVQPFSTCKHNRWLGASSVWGNACKAELQSCVLFAGVGRLLKHCAAWGRGGQGRKKKRKTTTTKTLNWV